MKVSWSNIHYVVFGVIILNFIMLYFIKDSKESSEDILIINEKKPIEPIALIEETEKLGNSTVNTAEATSSSSGVGSVAEDIGEAAKEGINPLPFTKNPGLVHYIDIVENKDIPSFEKEVEKPKSLFMAFTLIFILIIMIGLVSSIEYQIRKKGKIYGKERTYYLLDNELYP